MNLSFIILTYNESEALPGLIKEIDTIKSHFDYLEVIIVNDCSTDPTEKVLQQLKAEYPYLIIANHEKNMGVGGGMKTGILLATQPWIGYTDGDAQYVPDDLLEFKKHAPHVDIISGIRVQRADNWIRLIASACYNFYIQHVFKVKISDVNCGLKIYKRNVIESILPIESNGPFYDAEMLIKSIRNGYKLLELPVRHRPRLFGVAQGASFHSIMKTIQEVSSPIAKKLETPNVIGKTLQWVKLIA